MVEHDLHLDVDALALGERSSSEREEGEAPLSPPPPLLGQAPEDKVLGCPDLLERVLGFVPARFERCAAVNRTFHAAAAIVFPAVSRAYFARALAFGPVDLSTPPPSVPLSGYEIFVEVRSRRRDNAVVFACKGRFTDDDADLPLPCDNSVLGPPDFPSTLRFGDRVISTDNVHHLDVLGLHLVLDVVLVRCTDGAVCNFEHDDLAFFSPAWPGDCDHTTHMSRPLRYSVSFYRRRHLIEISICTVELHWTSSLTPAGRRLESHRVSTTIVLWTSTTPP